LALMQKKRGGAMTWLLSATSWPWSGGRSMQRTLVDRERQRASREVCERLRPRHREIVADIAAALRQLSTALEEERQLRERLIEADIDFLSTLRPMPFIAGPLNDPNSHASLWMREARDAGLL
jgi:hypothetical protein